MTAIEQSAALTSEYTDQLEDFNKLADYIVDGVRFVD